MKYIETELKKRKGIVEHEEQKVKPKNAEDCLYELPENIRVSSAKKTEEMLSNQMLSGIPEVDLGIDAKIKNIISTEDAKARLLAEQQNKKKDSETSFVPTNMAVNYVQHNRFYHEELNAPIRRNKEEPKARPLRVGDTEKPEPDREYGGCCSAQGAVEAGQDSVGLALGLGGWGSWDSVRVLGHGLAPSPSEASVSSSTKWGKKRVTSSQLGLLCELTGRSNTETQKIGQFQ
ncbi:Hepatocellular carcinoma-associated antigen 59 [Phyllostomus discolor]|uniref:Hepatocellular carcinoma-associated antigen 59 n=1 Tax=Phyllostomus discolor TaxID=89673 RepID=A0A834B5X4_9CHIR|nr:Hepatocellular carcinoma-associated antigen 59 [Phyllostomus discolor]